MVDVSTLTDATLVATIERLEAAYRAGNPEVSDHVFDHVYIAELRDRAPDHALLSKVGAEPDFGGGKVVHPAPMLSTDKVYTAEDVRTFAERVASVAKSLGLSPDTLEFELTSKLDGMAARYDGSVIVSRGDGLKGNDVSSAMGKGLVMDSVGVGEIVVTQSYFTEALSESFEHPRNFVVGCISADTLRAEAVAAFADGAIRFVNYDSLDRVKIVGVEAFCETIDDHCDQLESACDYPTDGCVVAVLGEDLQDALGQTSSHNRWQCAKKRKGESATSVVTSVEWTTGRTGRVTPTVIIEPISLSGATIQRVTAHHAGNVLRQGIGVGAVLRIVRAGLVIPTIDGIIEQSICTEVPSECPSCQSKLAEEGDFLICQSLVCDAQQIRRLHHFFEIIGNLDLFGEKTVGTLYEAGHTDLLTIYGLSSEDFEACGFGPKQSKNLVEQLARSRNDAVEDWRFLGAMGISRLGRGSSRRLLKVHPIETLSELSVSDIESVESFGPIVAPRVHEALQELWPTIKGLLALGFNLVLSSVPTQGILSGKKVVFTGAMPKPRKNMEADAERLGAEVQKSVSKATDYLITGERVGATKIEKAKRLGVRVLMLGEYQGIIGG